MTENLEIAEGTDEDSNQVKEEFTQAYCDSQPTTHLNNNPDDKVKNNFQDANLNIWGILRLRGGNRDEYKLLHRELNGIKDSYSIGRKKINDIVVPDKRISSAHCRIYCDYESARLKVVFVFRLLPLDFFHMNNNKSFI
jgi:hypothetical protein